MAATHASASKRRPVMPRRASSQSSAGSDAGSRETMSALASLARQQQTQGVPRHSAGSVPRRETAVSSSESSQPSEGLSAKAAGKRPAKPLPKPLPGRQPPIQTGSLQTETSQDRPVVLQQSPDVAPPLQRRSTFEVREAVVTREPGSRRRRPLPIAGFVVDQASPLPPQETLPYRSRAEAQAHMRTLMTGSPRPPAQALAATAAAEMSMDIVQGRFDSETITARSAIHDAPDFPDKVSKRMQPTAPALQNPMLQPTPPSQAPPIPFGRSKSELTVLLERDRELEKARRSDSS